MIAEPTRIAIYARCSSQGQAEKDLSIPAQLEAARDRARREGWEVVKEFVDEAETARTADRPSFQQMIADARRKPRPFERILVWKFSRFARNREDSVIYKRLLEKHGVRLISLNEPVDDTPAGQMLEGILEVLDEFYSANLAEDTVRGMRHNASLGFHNGGTTPVGYRIKRTGDEHSPKGVFEPDPEYAPVVKRVFAEALAGHGCVSIASTLNDEGLYAPRGRPWTKERIGYMLRNEVYTGVRSWGVGGKRRQAGKADPPIRIVDSHEALVTVEDFARVQAVMKNRRRDVIHPRRLGGRYLLSGLLVCGYCGKLFVGHGAKSGKVHYYGCQTKSKRGAKACRATLLNTVQADAAVTDQLREVVLTPEHFGELVRLVNEEMAARTESAGEELDAVEAQLAAARRKAMLLWEGVEAERMPMEMAAPRIRHWNARADELQARREVLRQHTRGTPGYSVEESTIANYVEGLRDLLDRGTVAERRAFLRAWIKRIEARGKELTVVYSFPRWPGTDGGSGKGSGGKGGGGANGGPRTKKAEPRSPEVLPMDKNGSPIRAPYKPSSRTGRRLSDCKRGFGAVPRFPSNERREARAPRAGSTPRNAASSGGR